LEYREENKSKVFKIKKSNITIGRSHSADLYLKNGKISRNHARIKLNANNIPIFSDLGSSGGSKVNGEKVNRIALRAGDTIQIGEITLIFKTD